MFRSMHKSVVTAAMAVAAAGTLYSLTPSAYGQAMDGDKKEGHPDEMHKADMGKGMAGDKMMSDKDIIETATGPGMTEVSTVVKAIVAADLVDTLKGPGPFTVFAPTNAAFDKLPAGTVEDLLKPENKEKLKSILLYHVHAGDAIKAADVKTMSLSTANGAPLMVKAEDGNVMINDAKVVKTDVVCKNGVIHWIDTVVMPPAK